MAQGEKMLNKLSWDLYLCVIYNEGATLERTEPQSSLPGVSDAQEDKTTINK